jgi:hypothetical protein
MIIVKTVRSICGNWKKVKTEKLRRNGRSSLCVVLKAMRHDKGLTGVYEKTVNEQDKN